MKKIFRVLAVAVFSVFLMSGSALALSIDFGYHGVETGFVSTDGTYGSGADILIDQLTVIGNPYGFNGPVDIEQLGGTFLEFAYTPEQNYIKIYTPGLDAPWLTGSFSSFTVMAVNPIMIAGIGPDAKADWLLQELGIPLDTKFKFFGFTIATAAHGGAYSVDISNTTVPEPTSMLLLGLGLLGIGIVSRKK